MAGISDSPEWSTEPSKVWAGTAECHVLVLNDVKTVKALPSLAFLREWRKMNTGIDREVETSSRKSGKKVKGSVE